MFYRSIRSTRLYLPCTVLILNDDVIGISNMEKRLVDYYKTVKLTERKRFLLLSIFKPSG